MKKLMLVSAAVVSLSVPALAADLPVKARPVPVVVPFTWTSCFLGGHVGGGWAQKDITDPVELVQGAADTVTTVRVNPSGAVIGGQFGCDYQFAPNWVIGVEGMAGGGNIGGSTAVVQPGAIAGDSATFKETTDFLTSATARVGFAWDHWLLYAKGGGAAAGDRYSAIGVSGGTPFDLEGLETRFGWTAGGGVEWAFWRGWSVKLEYNYYGFGSRSVTFIDPNTSNTATATIRQNIQVIMLGLNFHPFPGP
jgi:outer membrane immunogenic protein